MRVTWEVPTIGEVHMSVTEAEAPARVEALRLVGFDPVVTESVLVEVDVATCRPPRTDARIYTWLSVERTSRSSVQVEAEQTAMLMALHHPAVVMPVGARIIEWGDGQ